MDATYTVQNLIDKAVRLASGQPIKSIRATLGELTGLTPEQVRAEFDRCRLGTPAAGAELVLSFEPGRAVCLSCEQDVPIHAEGEACPDCGSYRRQIVAGQLLAVEGVSIDRSPAAARRLAPTALAGLSAEGAWDD
jgi:hydrogenase nickel incorporation protein HypA/HybF